MTAPGAGGERMAKMKVLSCKAMGVDCNWVGKGKTVDEVLTKAQEHGKKVHGMKEIPKEMIEKAKAVIRDE